METYANTHELYTAICACKGKQWKHSEKFNETKIIIYLQNLALFREKKTHCDVN